MTPSASKIDAVVGLSTGSASQWTQLAAIVIFDEEGNVRVRNGARYQALQVFPYTGGTTYTVRMVVDVAAKRYSVYIRPKNGTEVQLANNYAFRSEQASVASLANWAMTQTIGTATLSACNFKIQLIPLGPAR